jgi:AcrR family transcriptional regulator
MFIEHVQSRSEARDLSRSKVMSAAEELFVQRGFAGTTIRQIAERAAVSVGTVMAVADKDGLLVAIFDQRIASIQPAPADPQTAQDPVDEITLMLGAFVRFFAARPELARAYTSILVSGRNASRVFEELAGTLVQQVSNVLTRAGHSPPDASAIARLVHRAYLGELFIWAGQGSPDPAPTLTELEITVRYLVDRKAS